MEPDTASSVTSTSNFSPTATPFLPDCPQPHGEHRQLLPTAWIQVPTLAQSVGIRSHNLAMLLLEISGGDWRLWGRSDDAFNTMWGGLYGGSSEPTERRQMILGRSLLSNADGVGIGEPLELCTGRLQ